MPARFPFSIAPHSLATPFDAACARLDSVQFSSALWARRLEVWSPDPQIRQLIANRLGWLQAIDFVTPLVPRLLAFADSVKQGGFTDVVLGISGGVDSSLVAMLAAEALGPANVLGIRMPYRLSSQSSLTGSPSPIISSAVAVTSRRPSKYDSSRPHICASR